MKNLVLPIYLGNYSSLEGISIESFLKESRMNCKNCSDRLFCYKAPANGTLLNRKESAELLLRMSALSKRFSPAQFLIPAIGMELDHQPFKHGWRQSAAAFSARFMADG